MVLAAYCWSASSRDRSASSTLGVEQMLDFQCVETDGAVQLHLGIEVADGDADVRGRRVQLILGGADVRTPPREFGGNAERDARRAGARQGAHTKLGLERSRRLIQEQAERVDVLGFLLLQLRNLGADRFDLGGGVLDIETVLHPVLLALLYQPKNIAIDLQIVVSDPDLGLHAAQLDIVAGKFGQTRDQCVAALIGGLIDLGVGGFDLPAHPAPEIDFPRCVEANIEVVERSR